MNLKDKVKAFNLLPMTKDLDAYIEKEFPPMPNSGSFEYVRFYKSKPYFYSKAFIQRETIEDLFRGFAEMTGEMPEYGGGVDVDVQVSVLNLLPNDKIVLFSKKQYPINVLEYIKQQAISSFPDHQVVVLDGHLEMVIVRDAEEEIHE